MAVHLKARREALGLSQENAAARLGVDKDTVSRWERGRTKPMGLPILERLKAAYGVSQAELNVWFTDWSMKKLTTDEKYCVRGHEFLAANSMDATDFAQQIIDLDISILPGLADIDEGTAAQWASVFEASPLTWKLLTHGGKIVGYWQYVFLQETFFEKVKRGGIRDSEIDLSMLEFPCFLSPEKTYRMYIIMMGVHSAHQYVMPGGKLINSFVKEIEKAAVNGLFFSEIVTVAYTPQGVSLCENFGMEVIGHQPSSNRKAPPKIFYGVGGELAKLGHISKHPVLSKLYRDRFC
jgi:transcriptional regulator with XRE-family HTH domain